MTTDIVLRNDDNIEIEIANLPVYIGKQFDDFSGLDKKIQSAERQVRDAQQKADNAVKRAEEAKDKADTAQHPKDWFFGMDKTDAIKKLQEAALTFADAQTTGAEAQNSLAESQANLAEAQKRFFDYQKREGKILKGLYGLGISNMAANRTVVRELQLRLQGASEEEISDLARQEILNVIKQLKAQEDILSKQEKLKNSIADQQNELVSLRESMASEIGRIDSENERQDQLLEQYHQNQQNQLEDLRGLMADAADRITQVASENEQQDQLLEQQRQKGEEYDQKIAASEAKNQEQDVLLEVQQKKSIEHDQQLVDAQSKIQALEDLLEEERQRTEQLTDQLAEARGTMRRQSEKLTTTHDRMDEIQQVLDKKSDKTITYGAVALVAIVYCVILVLVRG